MTDVSAAAGDRGWPLDRTHAVAWLNQASHHQRKEQSEQDKPDEQLGRDVSQLTL